MQIEVEDRTHGHARAVHRHQQEADAFLLLRCLVGAYQQENPVGIGGQGGPDFLAIYHPLVTVKHGLGAQAGQVGAGVRLAVTLAPDVLAGQDARQEVLLLLGRAIADQQRPQQHDAVVWSSRYAVVLEFFGVDQLLGRRQAHAAELARPARCQPAVGRKRHVPVLDLFPVQALGQVAELVGKVLAQEVPYQLAKPVVGE
ncbi:hypothetical protein D9M68_634800 [compost metagenome]